MPKVDLGPPKHLRPYIFHGLDPNWRSGGTFAMCDCPFCGKEGKLSIIVDTGQWRCYTCGVAGTDKEGGNVHTFLKLLWDESDKATTNADHDVFAKDRRLLDPMTLQRWGVVKSVITDEWLVPGFSPDGKLINLYAYRDTVVKGELKKVLKSCWDLPHGLFGVQLFDPKKPNLHVCEGPWDGMVLWETMRQSKEGSDGRLQATGSGRASLLAAANVVAVPGAGIWQEGWCRLCKGKQVSLLYDNDHPVQNNGRTIQGAGWIGMRHAVQVMEKDHQHHPKSMSLIGWGKNGEAHGKDLKSGWDVRDDLSRAGDLPGRVRLLGPLLARCRPVPEDWVKGRSAQASRNGSPEVELIPCSSWKVLTDAWRIALRWGDGLDRALSVMMASVLSVDVSGPQLWIKLISPPSTGKSVLAEAMAVAKRWVLSNSMTTGFHSGYRETNKKEEDNSLVAKLYGKTMVTKDGDTLIAHPNYDVILSQGRDLYDRVARTHYGNKAGRDYEGVNFTWILMGTAALRVMDSSELGERFLTCKIMDAVDPDAEADINWNVMNRLRRYVKVGSSTLNKHGDDEAGLKAKQLTGGFIHHLRIHCDELLGRVEMSDDAAKATIALGTFTAYMRTRPSKKQDEEVQRELSTRLVEQMGRLAICLSAVLGKSDVDEEVMRRIRLVALDTSGGRTFRVAKELAKHKKGPEGLTTGTVARHVGETAIKTGELLRFMQQIGIVEPWVPPNQTLTKWRLTKHMKKLWNEVKP